MILTGNYRGKTIPLPDREMLIGREKDCFIRLFSSEISRRHCVLRVKNKVLFIEDLHSSNGTLVNGLAIDEEVPLRSGDRVKVGPAEFQVCPVQAAHDSSVNRVGEDDIASWLQDRKLVEPPDLGTTVIAPGLMQSPRPQVSGAGSTTEMPAVEKQKTKTIRIDRAFRSLHEEAQAIISRHLELHQQRR